MDLTGLPAAADDDEVDALADELGGVDVLVNCAGVGTARPFLGIDPATVREVLDVDLVGPFLLSRRAARRMIRRGRGGRIVNITSVHEHQPRVGAAPYCAAKGGLGLLTRVMALELAEHGITVNAVAPGGIATPMTGQEDVDVLRVRRPGVPLGRPGDAREVAAVAAFLAGQESGCVTGASWWSTAECSAWAPRPAPTPGTTPGAAPDPHAPRGREELRARPHPPRRQPTPCAPAPATRR